MTSWGDYEPELRNWLVDYLVTNIGCSPDQIDLEAPLNELGVGSREAVVLSGELSELLRRPVSPVDFWQNPTINALAHALVHPDLEPAGGSSPGTAGGSLNEPIAVIGLGCRLPGEIQGPDALWDFLAAGRSAVSTVPDGRWQAFDDGSPEAHAALANTTRWGSFLSDIAGFDAEFFGIAPREADRIDPQQRLLLEVAVEALEHAGIPAESLQRSQTGVFAGACVSEYGYLAARDLGQIDAWTGTGGALSIIANRLSYFLDLRGPSLTVDTACSSSLVAVHLACQSLRAGQSELAIAAGVNLLLSPAVTRSFDAAGAMSPTGACHAFDAAADGFVRGEGCGVAILKRLSDAERDGDRVLAVVRGSAVNQDGRSNGLMAPNPAAQAAVLRAACADAGVTPSEVDYVEAHGTGTLLGDPIEARALGAVYGRGRQPAAPLLVGAVKTNLGHLEAAAGILGLIKAALALQRGALPANLHFETPNSHIPFDELRLKVVDEATEWPVTGRPRRAGVSSFGFGGTNAHVVLEQGPKARGQEPAVAPSVTTLVVTGKNHERMAAMATTLADWMTDEGALVPLADVAHTLNHHRSQHPTFATVCAAERAEAIAGLRAVAAGEPAIGVVGPHEGPCGSGTVFVYSGQGSQWAGMGRRLLADEPAFAAAVAELEPDFVAQVGFSLRDVLATGQELTGIERIQPVLVGVQLALTALWRSHGVEPDAVIGHSMGEVTAAVVAGALTPAQGLQVIATRSRLMAERADKGAIALLELDAQAAEALIADFPGVTVAVYASPRQTVVAGPTEAVDAVVARAIGQNAFARRVNVDVASHHAMMDPILPALKEALAGLTPRSPLIPVISTVENAGVSPLFDADHWAANLRNPVRFGHAVATAGATNCTFIEISPHPLLTKAISDTLADPSTGNAHHHSIGTLQRHAHDTVEFHTNLNATHTVRPPHGEHPPGPHPATPIAPWRHSRHWIDIAPALSTNDFGGQRARRPAGGDASPVPADWLYEPTWPIHPRPAADTASVGQWLVLGDADLGAELGCVPDLATDWGTDRAALRTALGEVDNVLLAPAAKAFMGAAIDVPSAYALFNEARSLVEELLSMDSPPRLYFVTRNAQPVADGDRANSTHAVLWGLGRTLALEHPEIWGGMVDVDDAVPAVLTARYVLTEAQAGEREDQVVYRGGTRHVPRLRRHTPRAATTGLLGQDTSQLVIGATGRIGPHLIQQLADMGAGTIVAVSRNPGGRLDELARRLSATGTTLITVAADAADEVAMAALFGRFGTELPSLEGIYLAAFGGGPVALSDMTTDDVNAMFGPKLDALGVLHTLALRTAVRHFLMFSSISGLLGSRWLAHYTATSNFLDTFAYARRNMGLPATVVNWGLWKSLAEGQTDANQVMSNSGLVPMPDEIAIRALSLTMASDAPLHFTVADVDWPLLATAYRTRGALRIVDEVLAGESAGETETDQPIPESEFGKALRECAPERRRELLADHIGTLASDVLGLPPTATLDPAAGFFQLGMDSLMSVTLQRSLGSSLGITLPAAVIYEYPTISRLTDALCKRMGYVTAAEIPATARSGLGARAQQRAKARQEAAAGRRKGRV
ncbi:phthiocerol/phenolphthiocerol synthesis polyketide synthase type I PpsB [Mycobacterium gallinarum]|uniref:Phthiocerol/phenolphthiocerol synthesis polyketide synthase type I PpsB n=1 Tax=Mycobacterium gallinarum TaxID=39689 RepID=A0A9W4B729_9MYCO|nr:type I polyketide synthase [Mycobacterium gallinarum]BBY95271.1 phthiocerol/phenolphthiocerol synthesis polyketide synthase type I PpsB [Mycobacterium gallinarum]